MSTPSEPRRGSSRADAGPGATRLLITAGPTHEPIDDVRYLGNRSSGRLGIALADAAAARGLHVMLLLGPTHRTPSDSRVQVERFQTTSELESLLDRQFARCDVLVMAAAVSDYRPVVDAATLALADGKLRRAPEGLTLRLEPTPDLLAECAGRRRAGQTVVGFALEPRARLLESARSKLARKRVDLIVANPKETMDAEGIEATVLGADGTERATPGVIAKEAFAGWLLDVIDAARHTERG